MRLWPGWKGGLWERKQGLSADKHESVDSGQADKGPASFRTSPDTSPDLISCCWKPKTLFSDVEINIQQSLTQSSAALLLVSFDYHQTFNLWRLKTNLVVSLTETLTEALSTHTSWFTLEVLVKHSGVTRIHLYDNEKHQHKPPDARQTAVLEDQDFNPRRFSESIIAQTRQKQQNQSILVINIQSKILNFNISDEITAATIRQLEKI